MSLIDLSGKVALVTGGARGIGAAVAALLAEHGAGVVATDVLEEAGRATVEAIRTAGGRALFRHHDVRDEAGWQEAIAAAVTEFGGLDILVNNAGIESSGFLADFSVEDYRTVFDVNVLGTYLGLKYAARTMRPGGQGGRGGSVINLSSVAGLVGTSGYAVYSGSKGAVRLLSKSAAVEFGRLGYNIRVNSVHPGLVDTAMGNDLLKHLVALGTFRDVTQASAAMLGAHPIGRTGLPVDIARAILFLASDLSAWVTGTEIVVDGGMTAT
ncbi:MAG TPA: glucose 1-dehydrogenase [Stellaceae bacterium]|nr:glucose 1-dehydrogenase [Stellaceae bacterium]